MIVLSLNALLYIITSVVMYKKLGMRPFVFLWIYYTVFAVFGVFVVWTDLYFMAFQTNTSKTLSIIPYICNYTCLLLITLPLSRVTGKENGIRNVLTSPKTQFVFKFILLLFALYMGVKFYELSLYGNLGYAERHKMIIQDSEGIDIGKHSVIMGYLARVLSKVYQICYPLVMFYVLMFLRRKIGTVRLLAYFTICVAPMLIGYYINGNRAGMFYLFVNLAFFFFIIKDYLSKKQRLNIYVTIGVLAIVLISFSLSISNERFSHTDIGTTGSILRYFGETFPNLGYQYWDEVRKHTLGARQFGSYYFLLTGVAYDLQGFDMIFDYWSFYTGVDCALFKTVFGDLYIEFGTIGAMIFVIVLYLVLSYLIRRSEFSVFNLPFYYYYFAFCTNCIFGIGIMYTSTSFIYVLIGIWLLRKWMLSKNVFKVRI